MAVTLRVEGMPSGWELTIDGQPALHAGATSRDPLYTVVTGKRTYVTSRSGQKRSALLNVGDGANVVAWTEFRDDSKIDDSFAGVAIAAVLAGVVYSARKV